MFFFFCHVILFFVVKRLRGKKGKKNILMPTCRHSLGLSIYDRKKKISA